MEYTIEIGTDDTTGQYWKYFALIFDGDGKLIDGIRNTGITKLRKFLKGYAGKAATA